MTTENDCRPADDPERERPATLPSATSQSTNNVQQETDNIPHAEFKTSYSEGWIALHRSDEARALIEKHPSAFLLLSQVSLRARWKDCPITGLRKGEALIGDWKKAGLPSEKAYRHAKKILKRCQLAAFRGASKGTVATLIDSRVFSLSMEDRGGQKGNQGADEGRTRGEQGATNKKDKNDYKENKERLSLSQEGGSADASRFEIQKRINGLKAEWEKPEKWSKKENDLLTTDAVQQFAELTEEDWKLLKDFLAARIPQAEAYFQPHNRDKFVESFSNVLSGAIRWRGKVAPTKRSWTDPKPAPSPAGRVILTREEINTMLSEDIANNVESAVKQRTVKPWRAGEYEENLEFP